MSLALAVFAGIAVAATLWFLIRLAAQRSQLVKSLAFPLYVAALAVGLKIFTLFEAESIRELAHFDVVLAGVLTFLIAIVVIRVVGLIFFDVYLHSSRGVRLPPLLPKVAIGTSYLIAAILVIKLVGS